ncbi:MAG: type II secretion system F family protein [Pirellulaceae bacterium]
MTTHTMISDVLWALGPLGLILIGCLLLWFQSGMHQGSASATHSAGLAVVKIAGWVTLIAGLVLLSFTTSAAFSVALWIVAIVVLIAGLVRYRRSEVQFLIWNLAEAAQRGIPLDTVARAFANEQHGGLANRARNLADYLDAAMPLSLALSRSRLSISPEIRVAADVGEKTGTLSQSLKKALQQASDFDRLLGSLFAKVFYLSGVLGVMVTILTFLMFKIIPTFQKMFQEFGLQLPAMTQLLIAVSSGFVRYWYIALPVLWLCGLVAIVLLFSYLGLSLRGLPIVGRFFSAVDSASVLQMLAVAVREKRPLVGSLELLATYCGSSRVRYRLQAAIRQIADGNHWCDALQHVGFVTQAQAAVFKSAERAGNLAWALEEMADATVRRSSYRTQAALNFVFPLLILGCGMCVLFVALAMSLPLFSLIEALA